MNTISDAICRKFAVKMFPSGYDEMWVSAIRTALEEVAPLLAAQTETGNPVTEHGAQTPLQVYLTEEQVRELFAFLAAGDGDFIPCSLFVGNGHSGFGLYGAQTEYPEEGATFIAPIFNLPSSFVDRATSDPTDEPPVIGAGSVASCQHSWETCTSKAGLMDWCGKCESLRWHKPEQPLAAAPTPEVKP